MAQEELKEIIHGRVNIQVGKHGISDGITEQITNQFKNNKYLKIRFLDLHMFENMDDASFILAQRTNAKVVDVRGKTCVLERLGK